MPLTPNLLNSIPTIFHSFGKISYIFEKSLDKFESGYIMNCGRANGRVEAAFAFRFSPSCSLPKKLREVKMDFRAIPRAKFTPQDKAIPGRENEMKPNYAGGIAFKTDPVVQLYRLLLSVPNQTYYRTEEDVWFDLRRLVEYFLNKGDYHILIKLAEATVPLAFRPHTRLAMYAFMLDMTDSPEVKKAVRESFIKTVKSLNYLQEFMRVWVSIRPKRKSNSSIRKLINAWFEYNKDDLEYQAVKYFERHGWSVYDLMRFAHPKLEIPVAKDIVSFRRFKYKADFNTRLFKLRKELQNMEPEEVASLIVKENLFREVIPENLRKNSEVLKALAKTSPALSFIKSIPELASAGLLDYGDKEFLNFVCDKIMKSAEVLHPFDLAVMYFIYSNGETRRRRFNTIEDVKKTLNEATLKAFNRYKETDNPFGNKKVFIAVDTSGSMWGGYTTAGILPIQSAAVFSKLIGDAAMKYVSGTFADYFKPFQYDFSDDFNGIIEQFHEYGACCGTNAGSAIEFLIRKQIDVDLIVMITDSQSWHGKQVAELVVSYRDLVGKEVPIFLINTVPAYCATQLLDPKDPLSFELVGDSADIMRLIEMAVAGKLSPNFVYKLIEE